MVAMHGGGILPTWASSWCPNGHLCAWGSTVSCDRDGYVRYTDNNQGSHWDHHKATEGFPSTILGDSPASTQPGFAADTPSKATGHDAGVGGTHNIPMPQVRNGAYIAEMGASGNDGTAANILTSCAGTTCFPGPPSPPPNAPTWTA